jgi:hypothetical protein
MVVFTFDDRGNFKQQKTLHSWTGGLNWRILERTEFVYAYSDRENPNNIVVPEVTARKVYGADGAVIIQSDIPEMVQIYSLSGVLVRSLELPAGNQSISLPKGFYIIRASDKAYKVMVS